MDWIDISHIPDAVDRGRAHLLSSIAKSDAAFASWLTRRTTCSKGWLMYLLTSLLSSPLAAFGSKLAEP